ncbi:unnamed protein product [Aureobasidium mustum]|uniref:F-box domain-containing protein n=1 Tax=Aureobasidium mustum TaxID=2773714 RepID=A0A9N8K6C7_9PEZI|nr:unnamed protein product [Aureobasidium mustum]
MASIPSTSTPSPLLSLPAELRLQIYKYVFDIHSPCQNTTHLLSQYCGHNTWKSAPISHTCSLIRNETLPLYFSTGTFIYDLRSPLDDGVKCLVKVLQWLRDNQVLIRQLRFKHCNKGILSLHELRKWVECFVEYDDVLPRHENITFCQQGLQYRKFAVQAACVLKALIGFSASVNKNIIGSGEDKELEDWIERFLEKTNEGKTVLGGVKVAEEFVRGFGAAAGGEVQGFNVLRWALMSGGMIEGLKHAGYT